MSKDNELVLCVKVGLETTPNAKFKLDVKNMHFIARKECETDPVYKQIIPYVVLYDIGQDSYLTYQRKSGDSRLLDKFSIGVGGHVNTNDVYNTQSDFCTTIQNNINRELQEELGGRITASFTWWDHHRGFIYDPSNLVGEVHLGVLFIKPVVLHPEKFIFEDDEHKFSVMPYKEVIENFDKMENWSQITINSCLLKKRDDRFIREINYDNV